MISSSPNTRAIIAAASFFGALSLAAQVSFTGSYEEDFNSLPLYEGSSGTATFNFSNNTTIPGWYSTIGAGLNEGRSSGGSAANSGTIYNWGRDSDRALGTFSDTGYGGDTEYFGVRLVNDTTETISAVSVSYLIEKWRNDVNETTWTLEYLVTSSTSSEIGSSGYTTVTGRTISDSSASAGGANGNWSGNQTEFELTIENLDWEEGDSLWLRWTNDQPADGVGFGLDDLNVTAIPEPSQSSLAVILPVLLILYSRRRDER